MPRSLSTTLRAAMYAQDTAERVVVLLTLSHASFHEPIRLCSENAVVTSVGLDYQPFPFLVDWASDGEDAPPRAKISIDTADRAVVDAVRSVGGDPITATVALALASAPDAVEAGPVDFTLRGVTYSAGTIEGELVFDALDQDACPDLYFTPAEFPGLF